MKGRKLSLQEVLNLEDGTKVWVDFNDKVSEEKFGYEDCHYLCFKSEQYECLMMCAKPEDRSSGFEIRDNIEVYEWIELYENPMFLFDEYDDDKLIRNMATEICNLRSIDLTDENIAKIVKEFS